MKNKLRSLFTLTLIVSTIFVVSPVRGEVRAADTVVDWIGEIDGAAYIIRVPDNWNGTLLVYARGYSDEVPDPPDAAVGGDAVVELLLDNGYALAGSAYRSGGWAVKEGIQDTLALTNFFREQVGEPEQIILYGRSMGGLITAESIEKYPDIYNAGIPMCGVMAGATEFFDYLLDVGLAYDVSFGWPSNWGTVEDVRDKVDIWTHVLPVTTPQTLDPANIGHNEFVRLVSDLQFPGYYLQLEEGYGFLVLSAVMVHARADIEQRTGGNPSQNIDQVYSLSADELAYLMNLGVDAQSLLDSMNARTTITADVKSRKYLQRYADLTGRINKPMLILHTMYDPVTPVEMVSAYAEQVSAMGNEAYLTRVYTSGEGHCSFTPQQLLRAFQGMEIWLDTGYAPGADFFPESLGFDNDFEPGPWE